MAEIEVAIAGGHGRIALLLGKLLSDEGHNVLGLIRNPEHEADLHAAGVEPVLCDLEGDDDLAAAVKGADAVVFAAGAGPGSGAERKRTMDLGGAVKLIEAAKETGIRRYLMVSAMGAADPPPPGEGGVFGEYLRAKAAADQALEASGLEYTIVRPGGLTDEPPTGRVELGSGLDRGQIPRADVAAILHDCLFLPHTIDWTFEAVSGETPIEAALASL
ncbi:MAG: SDR family oxidoreductase [Solirubrobacterales bacterium]